MSFMNRAGVVGGLARKVVGKLGALKGVKKLDREVSRGAVVEALEGRALMTADLIVSAMTGVTGTLTPGQVVAGTVTVRNIAIEGAAGPSQTSIVLSTDKIYGNGDDYVLVDVATPSLAVGKSIVSPFSAKLTDAIPDGTYFVLGRADNLAEVVEFSNDNNTLVLTAPVKVARSTLSVTGPAAAVSESGGKGSFTITRAGAPSSVALDVQFEIVGGATRGVDYELKVGATTLAGDVVTIPAKASSVTITLFGLGDTLVEGPEGLTLNLLPSESTPVGYVVNALKDSASATIRDDEPTVKMTVSSNKMNENGSVTFTVTRSGGSNKEALLVLMDTFGQENTIENVDYKLVGSDGKVLSHGVTIPANAASVTFKAVAIDDSIIEGNESFLVHLAPSLSYAIDPLKHEGTVTIMDNEPKVKLTQQGTKMNEDGSVSFTLTRSGGSNKGELTAYFQVIGSALLGTDFKLVGSDGKVLTDSIVFKANAATAMFKAVGIDDQSIEGTEGFAILLKSAPGTPTYTVDPLAKETHTSIIDNEPTVKLTASSAKIGEATGSSTFTVTRSGGSNKLPLTVFFEPSGKALQGVDYKLVSSDGKVVLGESVTLGANAGSVTFKAVGIDDSLIEGDEAFTLSLVGAPGAPTYTIDALKHAGTVTITDNEPMISLSTTSKGTTETKGSASFTVTRSGGSNKAPLTVYVSTLGTAGLGTDFNLVAPNGSFISNSVVIPANAASVTFKAVVIDDTKIEGTENLQVLVTAAPGEPTYTINPLKASATISIADNEPTVSVVAVKNASETNPGVNKGQFKFTRTGGSTATALTVPFTIINSGTGAATFSTDYSLSSSLASAKLTTAAGTPVTGSITFAAGVSSVTVDVIAVNDATTEGTETVALALTNTGAFALESGKSAATVNIVNGPPAPPGPGSPMVVGAYGTSLYIATRPTHEVNETTIPIINKTLRQTVDGGAYQANGQTGGYFYTTFDGSPDTATNKRILFTTLTLPIPGSLTGENSSIELNFTGTRPAGLLGKTVQFFAPGTAGTHGTFIARGVLSLGGGEVRGTFKIV